MQTNIDMPIALRMISEATNKPHVFEDVGECVELGGPAAAGAHVPRVHEQGHEEAMRVLGRTPETCYQSHQLPVAQPKPAPVSRTAQACWVGVTQYFQHGNAESTCEAGLGHYCMASMPLKILIRLACIDQPVVA